MGTCIIRDDPAEAQRVFEAMFERNGRARLWKDQLVGTSEQVAEKLLVSNPRYLAKYEK